MRTYWQSLSLVERIRLIRYVLPIVLIPIVVIYQLEVALRLEESFGHAVHYAAEISFYSLAGPVVTWLTLIWVERRLAEKETLEHQVRARTRQLASLTAASSDAIISLDHKEHITSWNQGAARLFGYFSEAIMGHPVDVILPEAAGFTGQSQEEGTPQNFETTAVTRHGHTVRVDLTHTRLEQGHGESPVSLLVMRDVTVRAERAAILEEERGRISRDLHDGVAQTLYFLALKADMTNGQFSTDPEQAVVNLKEIGQQARRGIQDVRRAIFSLKPLDWSNGDFLPSLQKFAEEFGQEVNLQITMQTEVGSSTIPPRLEPTLFRLVQESLNNVAKHSEASTVQIRLHKDESLQQIVLNIRDNGIGFNPEAIMRGFGLNQMEKRIAALDGKFRIISQTDQGTEIRAEIPLKLPGEKHG